LNTSIRNLIASADNSVFLAADGIDVYEYAGRGGTQMTAEDVAEARTAISRWYEPPGDVDWGIFVQMVMNAGWTHERFQATLLTFFQSKVYPKWKPADFFTLGSPRVYPHSWYTEQILKSKANAALIGQYIVPGYSKPMFGWRHEVGTLLAPWPVVLVRDVPALPPAPEDAAGSETVKPEITDRDITAALTIQRQVMMIEDLEQEVRALKAKLSERELTILSLKHDARMDQLYIDKLLNRTYRHLEMLYPNATHWKTIEAVTVPPAEGKAA
jgi:hypothetical protein